MLVRGGRVRILPVCALSYSRCLNTLGVAKRMQARGSIRCQATQVTYLLAIRSFQ